MKRKIIFLSIGLFLTLSALIISVAAWLTDTKESDDTSFTIGYVKYEFIGYFKDFTNPIVPGEELIASEFKLRNSSTIATELRVLVTVKVNDVILTNPSTLFTTSSYGAGFSLADGWVFNEGYWYYYVAGNDTVIAPTVTEIPFLSSLKLDGTKVSNNYANANIYIVFTFQAKQAAYVTWEDLGEIDFALGI